MKYINGITRAAGYTLIELLMTMSVAAIVAMIGVPSFRYVTNSNRIAGEINGLVGDLQLARAEAIKEGRNVTVCISTTGTGCSTGGGTATNWQSGWMVFSDPTNVGTYDPLTETILRVQSTFTNLDTFHASNNVSAITFNREGYAAGIAAGTLITLHDSTGTTAWTRCLSINSSGMMSSMKHGDTVNGAPCN
jgi:type IV fimbrial biogenesis protein FimT